MASPGHDPRRTHDRNLGALVGSQGRAELMGLLSLIPWRWAAVAAGVALCGMLYAEIKRVGRLEAQLDAATSIANANAEIADQERTFRRKADEIASVAAAKAERARRRYLDQRREVTDARDEGDGPLAPVLRHVLDGLPESTRSAATD